MKKIGYLFICCIMMFLLSGCTTWNEMYSEYRDIFDNGVSCEYNYSSTADEIYGINKVNIKADSNGINIAFNGGSYQYLIGVNNNKGTNPILFESSAIYFNDFNYLGYYDNVAYTDVCPKNVYICRGNDFYYHIVNHDVDKSLYLDCEQYSTKGNTVKKGTGPANPDDPENPGTDIVCYLDNAINCHKYEYTADSGSTYYIELGFEKLANGSVDKYIAVANNEEMLDGVYKEAKNTNRFGVELKQDSFVVQNAKQYYHESDYSFSDTINVSEEYTDGRYFYRIGNSGVSEIERNEIVVPEIDVPPMEFCEQARVLQTFRIIGIILFILKIVVPVIIIIFGTIDFAKALMDSNDKSNHEAIMIFVKRLIIGVVIFLIPTILDLTLSFVDGAEDTTKGYSACTSCLFNPFNGCN